MLSGIDIRTALKRGALVAAANWQVTVIQFMAESTFKMLLSVPVVGGLLLVVLVLGRELPELFSPDIRESITFVATALAAEPPALISFLLAFGLVALAGSAFMFLLKGGTVAVLAVAEREAAAVEDPPLRLEPFWSAARFTVARYEAGCRQYLRRFLRLGFVLILVYGASAAAYLAVLLRGADWFAGGPLGWTAIAGIGSTVLVVWVTLVNFFYLLVQMVVVVEECSVRSAARKVVAFLRAEPALTVGVFGVVLLLVMGATIVSIVATTSLGLIAFVPLAGLAVVPLQLLAWLFRGLVFQFLSLSALGAYLTIYRRYRR
ncbi:MAG: hypothetical protein R6V57_16970 [Vicinamibacterales bacterium]